MSARSEILGNMPPAYSIHDRAEVVFNAAELVIEEKNAEIAAVKDEIRRLTDELNIVSNLRELAQKHKIFEHDGLVAVSNVIQRLRDWAKSQALFAPGVAADSILTALFERLAVTGTANAEKEIIASRNEEIRKLRRRVIAYQVSMHMTREELELLEKIISKAERLKSEPAD